MPATSISRSAIRGITADAIAWLGQSLAGMRSLLGNEWWEPEYESGIAYHALSSTGITGGAIVANRVYYLPFLVKRSFTAVRIGCSVTAAVAGSLGRLGLYQRSGRRPLTRLVDGGESSAARIGEKEVVISQPLAPGLVWIAATFSAAVTINVFNVAQIQRLDLGSSGGASGAAASLVFWHEQPAAYGALPASAGTLTANGAVNPPVLWLKA